jgi:hypothetical protein
MPVVSDVTLRPEQMTGHEQVKTIADVQPWPSRQLPHAGHRSTRTMAPLHTDGLSSRSAIQRVFSQEGSRRWAWPPPQRSSRGDEATYTGQRFAGPSLRNRLGAGERGCVADANFKKGKLCHRAAGDACLGYGTLVGRCEMLNEAGGMSEYALCVN